MSVDTRNLQGARASSAVRCIARAEFEGLGAERDPDAQFFLEKHFRRGVNVGRAWASGFAARAAFISLEHEVPWGPPEYGWVGHADVVDTENRKVYEAYHAAGGAFREEKALQAAFYADSLGPEYTAELAVIDTTDVSDEEGFAVQPYEINVDGLRDKVRDIKRRVVAAVEAGAVNPADKIGDSPRHSECASCPFRVQCWAGWQPPHPSDAPGLEAQFEALRITEGDLREADARAKLVKERRDGLREQVREFLEPGVPVRSGDTVITLSEVKGRVTFKLGDAQKAGYQIPDELTPFVKVGAASERWRVEGPA